MGGVGARLRPSGRTPARLPAGSAATGLRGLSTTRLILVGQGATTATRGLAFPTDDDPLDPTTTEALQRLGSHLGRWPQASAAPARAARDTAAALASTVAIDPGLRDCDYGRWAGRALTEIQADEPGAFARWLNDPEAAPHGGEALAAVVPRLRGWLDSRALDPGKVLAVGPTLVIRALVVAALDLPLAVFWRLDASPLGVSRLSVTGGRWRLASLNAAPERRAAASPAASPG